METCFPASLGLTQRELEQIEREIADDDEKRQRNYEDSNEYYDWKAGLEVKKEVVKDHEPVLDDTSGTFMNPFNGARCLCLAIFEGAVADLLRYHPENVKGQNRIDRASYKEDLKTYNDAEYFIFGQGEATAEWLMDGTRYKVAQFRTNALKRLNDLRAIGWAGYAKRSKEHTQKNYHSKGEV